MIILEGPDNSGKTTLANKISARYNHPVYHAGGPPANKDEAYKRLSDTLNTSLIAEFSLHDRHILFGETIYGKNGRSSSICSLGRSHRIPHGI